jgi:outer membrane cobalamin receptor
MVRYDYYSDFEGAWSFKLAVNQALSSRASLKGSISNSFRAPTFSELYWPSSMWAEGNPDLNPERGYSIDFGITRVGEAISYDLFLFTRFVENVIVWQEGSDFKWRPTNFGEAFYPGIEARLDAAITKSMQLNLGYTFLYSLNLSGDLTRTDDERMPYIPINELDFGLDYRRRMFGVGFNGHFETKRYYEDWMGEMQSLPSYLIFDAHYRQNIGKATTFLLSVDNLFNKQYEVVPGYPMPGLFIRTGFEFEF